MTTWIVDLQDKVGQRVLPSAETPTELNLRFRKVNGETLREALDHAQWEVIALKKLQSIQSGNSVLMSDKELDWLIDQGVYPTSVVSIANPQRCGILDAFLVANKDHAAIKAYRDKVTAAYEAQPEIRRWRKQQAALQN